MHQIMPFLVPIGIACAIAAAAIFRGPIGRAIADRIAGRVQQGQSPEETEALAAAVQDLGYRLGEVEERLDFTERMLAQRRSVGQLE